MSYLNKSQQEAKQKHLNNQNIHKQRMREKKESPKEKMRKLATNYMQMHSLKSAPDNETWEAKQFRIKQTAAKVDKAIGLCQ